MPQKRAWLVCISEGQNVALCMIQLPELTRSGNSGIAIRCTKALKTCIARACRRRRTYSLCPATTTLQNAADPSPISSLEPDQPGLRDRRNSADGLKDRRGNFAVHANQRYGVSALMRSAAA